MTQSHKREEKNGILKWEMTSNRRSIEVALKVAIKRGRDTDSYVIVMIVMQFRTDPEGGRISSVLLRDG